MSTIVALDLETTGLNAKKDAIIEIGAIRFTKNRVEAEFSQLINPGRQIPNFISQLTGITNAMVRNAPRIEEVLDDLEQFVGDHPVLGHNVKFDLGFVRQQGILKFNDPLDTYDMASVLLPNAGRYNLAALGQILGIPFPATHRALDDAKVTYLVYEQLYEKALNLPIDMLAEIVRMGETIEWGAGRMFTAALKEKLAESGVEKPKGHYPLSGPWATIGADAAVEPLNPVEDPKQLDIEEVAAMLEHGGVFSKHFPKFEYRQEQVEMTRVVTKAISSGQHMLVEAGTGTGKSLAYIVPAALWALQNKTRVVISTNTINLQDQLINKDIPDVQAVLETNFRAAVLKGRRNYLCPRRLEAMRKKKPENADEMRVMAKMLIWLKDSKGGDLSEINITGPAERSVWARISAENEGCTSEMCVRRMGAICPFHQARQAAQSAHIIVVNHALLLADVATGNRILPDYEYLIVDEAHHIESATTNALSFRVSQTEVERTLRELGGKNAGVLGRILSVTKSLLDPGMLGAVSKMVEDLTDKSFQFQNQLKQFFIAIDQFLVEQRDGRQLGSYSQQVRIVSSTRVQPEWLNIELSWEQTQRSMTPVTDLLEKLSKTLGELVENGAEEVEDLSSNLGSIYRRIAEIDENVNAMVFEPSEMQIYWVEINPQYNQLSIQAVPLHIGHLMEKYLWHEKLSVILTSATLTAAGDFEYFRSRLNAFDADELSVGSPFDYENSALLYLPNNIPEPSDRNGHQRAIENSLIALCKATGGKALALFTSYAQLKSTSKRITPILAEQGIQVYQQGEGASPHVLLETFKNSESALLLGTRAFWEGVDIPGDALSVLFIVKIPFDVPSDPIIAARSETFEDPFFQYSIPEAILRFRQGFGRLIRTQHDRGVVVILDRRLLTKQYGKMFIDSLPECTVINGRIEDLPAEAVKWLGI